MNTWRTHAAPVVRDVLERIGTSDPKALRKALREAYPFGQRKYWPYKIWLDEIRRQLSPTPASPSPGPDGPLLALMQ